jgi:hypothetical protein
MISNVEADRKSNHDGKKVSSIGVLFRVVTEYDRRDLCVKEKEVPYVVAGCVRDRMPKNAMTTARGQFAGRVRRESQKGGFRAYGGANRKPDQNRLTGRINTPSGREAPGRSRPPQRRATGRRTQRRERGEPGENVPSVPIWRWPARDRDAVGCPYGRRPGPAPWQRPAPAHHFRLPAICRTQRHLRIHVGRKH